ncbi:hypothetical protein [Duganella sp. BJB1802]|nr:hypothetical protein [Duganella sp. BJB1802]
MLGAGLGLLAFLRRRKRCDE